MVATGQEFEVIRTVLGISILVLAARLLGTVASKFEIPEVIGEIFAGMLLGPYAFGSLFHVFGSPLIDLNPLFLGFAIVGGIIVLLDIGLSFKPLDLVRSGTAGFIVALSGVAVPFFLGYYIMLALGFNGDASLVIGASLTATSIAITYEVLKELKKHHTKEAKIIISAAVIDDILGIIVLSLVLGLTGGANVQVQTLTSQFIFLMLGWAAIVAASVALSPKVINLLNKFHSSGAIEAGVTLLAFTFAIAASIFGLSPIVGAFAVGMSLTKSPFYRRIKSFVSNLMIIFGPLFFAVIGTYLNPMVFSISNIPLVVVLLSLAVSSKYIGCGLPAWFFLKDVRKASKIGIGMSSRGEIAFIILGIALTNNTIPDNLYSIALLSLMATSIAASVLLENAYKKDKKKAKSK